MSRMTKLLSLKVALNVLLLVVVVCFNLALVCASSLWRFLTWGEIIWHLNTPFNGVDYEILYTFLDLVWPVLIGVLFVFFYSVLNENKRFLKWLNVFCVCSTVCVVSWFLFFHKLDVWNLFLAPKSTFVEEHYADPKSVKIEFTEKRNLIHIYLESVETLFSAYTADESKAPTNLIPNLTKLAHDNINFSDSVLNGAFHTENATWTAASIIAQNSGLPVRVRFHKKVVSRREQFFPLVRMSYDILRDNGYSNYFLIGSKSEFAAKDLMMKSHGDITLYDYQYFIDNNLEKEDDFKHWGAEDKKMLQQAKKLLTEISQKQTPFTFSLLTVDTHPNGWIANECKTSQFGMNHITTDALKKIKKKDRDNYRKNFYKEALKCSDRQIYEFVEWIKQQPFYENTTIILTGDHLVQSDFVQTNRHSADDVRKSYASIVNPSPYALEDYEASKFRDYNLFDMFPTILASIGAKIEGDRLGLGTNLFSTQQTLVEKYGVKHVNKEVLKQSELLKTLQN